MSLAFEGLKAIERTQVAANMLPTADGPVQVTALEADGAV